MADKKDEIINLQLDIIRKMTENNIRRLSDDIWGPSRKPSQNNAPSPKPTSSDKMPPPPPISVETKKPADDLTKASDGADIIVNDSGEDAPPRENIEDLKKELDSYIGLEEVKKEVKNLINMATVYKLRQDNNLPNPDMSLHLVFSGNPGTGKTMIARFMARVYHSLGLLSVGKLVEVDRSGLVAGYIGQTAIKTAKVLESAKGSVLFIDEAYTLTSKTENDFGLEAVDTILKAMEDNRDDLVVIAAGYIDLMEEFIDSNPGLRSRFNKYIDFADYTAEEMLGIFRMNCDKSSYVLDADAEPAVKEYFTAVSEANRIAELPSVTRDDLMKITKDDVTKALFEPEDLADNE